MLTDLSGNGHDTTIHDADWSDEAPPCASFACGMGLCRTTTIIHVNTTTIIHDPAPPLPPRPTPRRGRFVFLLFGLLVCAMAGAVGATKLILQKKVNIL